jgi:hypothetical protein
MTMLGFGGNGGAINLKCLAEQITLLGRGRNAQHQTIPRSNPANHAGSMADGNANCQPLA